MKPTKSGFGLKLIVGIVLLGSLSVVGLLISAFQGVKDLNGKSDAVAQSSPTPTPTPNLPPAEHLAAAKKLLQGSYDKEKYEEAMKHLSAIPSSAKESKQAESLTKSAAETYLREEIAGPQPQVSAYDGKVYCVDSYLRQTLNDYDSAEYLQWGGPEKVKIKGVTYWKVGLRLRAKNAFGAKIIATKTFLIQRGNVVNVLD